MIKLTQKDVNDPKKLKKMAALSNMSESDFIEYYREVIV
jgi:hypothetical protein